MLRPAVCQILKNNESYYSLVIAVAKRAREITDEACENEIVLEEKPVNETDRGIDYRVDEVNQIVRCGSMAGSDYDSHNQKDNQDNHEEGDQRAPEPLDYNRKQGP